MMHTWLLWMRAWRLPLSVVVAIGCVTHPASGRAGDDPRAQANAHFERGVSAFAAKRYTDAADEFQQAYDLVPAFQVLYNLGQTNVVLERHAEAARVFSDYLAIGGSSIAPSRRAEVEATLTRQRQFVGVLRLSAAPLGVAVALDGATIGSSAVERPIFVEPGPHRVVASLPGFDTETRTFEVPRGAETTVNIALHPLSMKRIEPHGSPFEPVPDPNESARIPAYVLGAGGAALSIVGGLLALAGAQEANAARQGVGAETTAQDWDLAKSKYDSGSARNRLGWFLVATGGAATLGAGVFLYVVKPKPVASWQCHLTAHASPTGSDVALIGVW